MELLDIINEYTINMSPFADRPTINISNKDFRAKYKKNEIYPNYYLVPDYMSAFIFIVDHHKMDPIDVFNTCYYIDEPLLKYDTLDNDKFTLYYRIDDMISSSDEMIGVSITNDNIDNITEMSFAILRGHPKYEYICTLNKDDIRKQLSNKNNILSLINFFRERFPMACVYQIPYLIIKANKKIENLKILASILNSKRRKPIYQTQNILHTSCKNENIVEVSGGMCRLHEGNKYDDVV
jgi:hypothetical protein